MFCKTVDFPILPPALSHFQKVRCPHLHMQQMTEMTDTNINELPIQKKNPFVLYVSQVRINYCLQRLWRHTIAQSFALYDIKLHKACHNCVSYRKEHIFSFASSHPCLLVASNVLCVTIYSANLFQSHNFRICSFSPKLKTLSGKCKHFSAK